MAHTHGDGPTNEECVDFLERIMRLIDNELEEDDCAVVRAHIDTCNPCLERYDLQRTVKAIVARSCSETAPDRASRPGADPDPADPGTDHRTVAGPWPRVWDDPRMTKTVLITGCSSGIGEATAARLVRSGWDVYATARRPETLSALADAGCTTLALDVTDEASMTTAVDAVLDGAGRIDALVNNAGYSQSGALESVDVDDVRRQFETNVFGLIRLTQLVLPTMREQRSGRIVNIGSMGGKLTFPGGGAYHASKYAVEALSDALRFEVAGFGIQVVLVEPGLITTNFEGAARRLAIPEGDGPYADFNAAVLKSTTEVYAGPMAKLGGPPEAVAKTIEKAITKKHPRPRYLVTPSAYGAIASRRMMPDRMWDLAMKSQFPQPK